MSLIKDGSNMDIYLDGAIPVNCNYEKQWYLWTKIDGSSGTSAEIGGSGSVLLEQSYHSEAEKIIIPGSSD